MGVGFGNSRVWQVGGNKLASPKGALQGAGGVLYFCKLENRKDTMAENAPTHSFITADVEIVGTVTSNSAIRIDGKLEGELICENDVAIGKTAEIKGNLSVNSISVAGTVNGNINAKDKIDLKSTAKLLGDIKAKRLSVEDGVTFVGRSEVNPTGAQAAPAPVQRESNDSSEEK